MHSVGPNDLVLTGHQQLSHCHTFMDLTMDVESLVGLLEPPRSIKRLNKSLATGGNGFDS